MTPRNNYKNARNGGGGRRGNNMAMHSKKGMLTDQDEAEINQKLLDLSIATGYPIAQVNGQRKYGPPPDYDGPKPAKGSEVFVGHLPRDIFEDELVPFCASAGKIYTFRLMMEFSGFNKGFGFCTYMSPEDADAAIEKLNNTYIRPGVPVGVCKSTDNCRLFIGMIPMGKSRQEIKEAVADVVPGVSEAFVHHYKTDTAGHKQALCYAFVEFEDHRAAAMARRTLVPGRHQLFGRDVLVDWAEAEPVLTAEQLKGIKALYIRDLAESTSDFQIMQMFRAMSKELEVVSIKRISDYAFVNFDSHEKAEIAMKFMRENPDHGKEISTMGDQVSVTWALPPEVLSQQRRDARGRRNRNKLQHQMEAHATSNSVPDQYYPGQLYQEHQAMMMSPQRQPQRAPFPKTPGHDRNRFPSNALRGGDSSAISSRRPPRAARMSPSMPSTPQSGGDLTMPRTPCSRARVNNQPFNYASSPVGWTFLLNSPVSFTPTMGYQQSPQPYYLPQPTVVPASTAPSHSCPSTPVSAQNGLDLLTGTPICRQNAH